MEEKMNLLKEMASRMAMTRDNLPPEQKWQLGAQAAYWGRALNAWEKGEPLNWHSFISFPEIFYAMGIPSLEMEAMGGMITMLFPDKLNEKYIDIAHENLIADHLCSTQKIPLGAALSGELPPPTTLVHTAAPCDSTLVNYPTVANVLGIPHFGVDVPTWKNERSIQYVADELERAVAFIEEHTGRKLEYEKLRETMENSNIAHEYNLKVNELTKLKPTPVANMMGAIMTSGGSPECAEYYKGLYEMAKAKAEKGEGYLTEEKVRLAWFSTSPADGQAIHRWMEQEFGAVVVNTMLGTDTRPPAEDISSTRKIMEALALNLLTAPMGRECWGTLESWFDYAITACKEWKVDAVIMTIHQGCKNIWAVSKLVKDTIADELGIPSLAVETDFCDWRVFPPEDTRAQITDFMKTMLA